MFAIIKRFAWWIERWFPSASEIKDPHWSIPVLKIELIPTCVFIWGGLNNRVFLVLCEWDNLDGVKNVFNRFSTLPITKFYINVVPVNV